MLSRRETGALGEGIVADLLKAKGAAIMEKNYRSRSGEIDIIAMDRGEVVFVEVKTRRGTRYGAPEEAVDYRKRKRLRSLAAGYLSRHELASRSCRFDVYSIFLNSQNEPKEVRVYENCF